MAQGYKVYRNNFNLSRERLTTGQIGKLIPVAYIPVAPKDRFDVDVSYLMRFSPLVAPTMARMNVSFHAFYVPHRIVTPLNSTSSQWENFIEAIGQSKEDVPALPRIYVQHDRFDGGLMAQNDPGNNHISVQDVCIGTLWDYLGLPTCAPNWGLNQGDQFSLPSKGISAFPFLDYLKIYNDWYRRDQIEREVVMPVDATKFVLDDYDYSLYDLPVDFDRDKQIAFNELQLFTLRNRNYERDYFNSALPEPQFGDDVVVGGGEIVKANAALTSVITGTTSEIYGQKVYTNQTPNEAYSSLNMKRTIDETEPSYMVFKNAGNSDVNVFNSIFSSFRFTNPTFENLRATPFTVNDLRLAMQMQGVREIVNRAGTRYLEIMKAIYNVDIPDSRLQRAQFLGGVKSPVTIGEVVQTSETANTPQGTLTGKAISANGGKLFRNKYPFAEHGAIMIIMSVTPRSSYEGGIEKHWLYEYPEDYYNPLYDHLGEEEVSAIELHAPLFGTDTTRSELDEILDTTFGYQKRYASYKMAYSTVTGEFRDTLDGWNIARKFDSIPYLSPKFIEVDPEDVAHIFEFPNIANTSNEHFQAQIVFTVNGKRYMSKHSTPFIFT